MINGIGVENFRSFKNSKSIQLKPITVFVGKNSSGKSSLLRTFPLFRQSVEENTTGPILWYGSYVDFGDFTDVISNKSSKNSIEFNFNLTITDRHLNRYSHYRYYGFDLENIDIKLRLTVTSKDKKTRTKEVSFEFDGINVLIQIEDNDVAKLKISFNDIVIERDGLHARNLGQFVPFLSGRKREDPLNSSKRYYYSTPMDRAFEASFMEISSKLMAPYFHNKTDPTKIDNAFNRLGPLSLKDSLYALSSVFREQKTFIKNLENNKEDIINKFYPYLVAWNINAFAEVINRTLMETFRNIKYIAPLRATSERFYRFQDLQVNEINHTGSNLAMLLNSLRPNEKLKFEEWAIDNFGFSVRVKQEGAHFAVTVFLKESQEEFNVSDMGFGYSQVLPIVTAIWLETERRESPLALPVTFIIEQPELHLHPAYQSNLAKIFAKVIAKAKDLDKKTNIRIIFETHSQTMIEALGECIEDTSININSDDISVIVFDKDISNSTTLKLSYFDDDGVLLNWPVGFFSGR